MQIKIGFLKNHAFCNLVLYMMFVSVRVKPCYQLKLLLLIKITEKFQCKLAALIL